MTRADRSICFMLGPPLLAVAAYSMTAQPPPPDRPKPDAESDKDVPMKIIVESSAFAPNAPIPNRHTGDGDDVSPPLTWSGAPDAAKEFALIMDDPDAPTDQPWVHWVLFKIPPGTTKLRESIEKTERPAEPAGALQGKNSFGKIGYGGPAPPRGHGVHHYHFKVYALSTPIDASPGITKEQLLEMMKGKVLAQGELIGVYERKK